MGITVAMSKKGFRRAANIIFTVACCVFIYGIVLLANKRGDAHLILFTSAMVLLAGFIVRWAPVFGGNNKSARHP